MEFRPGELFVYTRDGDCEHMELGQVCRKVNDDTYACWYSTGDTAARTNVRNMRKLANAGWSHVERGGLDDCCKMVTSGTPCDGNADVACSKCGASAIGDYYDPYGHRTLPKRCPECGRLVQ